MARKLTFSRWRRLPGIARVHERKIPGPGDDLQRLTLYLPGRLIDRAEALAQRAGSPSVQTFCEGLLRDAIESEHSSARLNELEARQGPLEGLNAIANDPQYLAEWTASNAPPEPQTRPATGREAAPVQDPGPGSPALSPEALVQLHADLADPAQSGLIASLRRGEPIDADTARQVVQALIDLERSLQGASAIDRRLAFALHRLAFMSQLLVTEAWPNLASDAATIETIRMLQESVDRVLSGEDIRYASG